MPKDPQQLSVGPTSRLCRRVEPMPDRHDSSQASKALPYLWGDEGDSSIVFVIKDGRYQMVSLADPERVGVRP